MDLRQSPIYANHLGDRRARKFGISLPNSSSTYICGSWPRSASYRLKGERAASRGNNLRLLQPVRLISKTSIASSIKLQTIKRAVGLAGPVQRASKLIFLRIPLNGDSNKQT